MIKTLQDNTSCSSKEQLLQQFKMESWLELVLNQYKNMHFNYFRQQAKPDLSRQTGTYHL